MTDERDTRSLATAGPETRRLRPPCEEPRSSTSTSTSTSSSTSASSTAPASSSTSAAGRQATPSIGRSTALMAAATLVSRLTGLARTVVFFWFGTTAFTETYLKANNTPNMVFELVVGGVLSATLVPLFVGLDGHRRSGRADEAGSSDGLSAIVSLVSVALTAAVVVVFVAAPVLMWIVFHRPDEGVQRQLGTQLLRLFAPQVAVYGFVTVATALLNARRRFLAPMLAPVLNNAVVIIVLIWARRLIVNLVPDATARTANRYATLNAVATDTTTKLLLGLGTTAGVVAMGLALAGPWVQTGVRVRWLWAPRHRAVKRMLRLSGWTLGYVAANIVALQFVAAALPGRGDFPAYNLAYTTFFLLPHGIFAVSVMTALQPELAQAYLDRKRGVFRRHLTGGIRTILAITVPAAAGYLALAPSIMRMFQVGDLTSDGARLVADVLRCFVVGLPAFSVYLLLMNACKAMLDTKSTFTINCVENALNIVLAAVFVKLGFGVQGLGAAFAASYILAVVLAGAFVGRRTGGLELGLIADAGRRIVGASAVMGVVVWGAVRLFHSSFDGRFALVEVGVGATLGGTLYLVLGRLFGIRELDSVTSSMRRRVR
jgi:putative peptidoglycan lipid II flippase